MKRFGLVVLCSAALLVLALIWARPLSRATLAAARDADAVPIDGERLR